MDARFRVAALAELMQREGLTKAEFARRVGVSRQLVGAWLSETVEPRFGTVLRLCLEFNVDPAFFADGLPQQRTEAAGWESRLAAQG